MTRETIRSGMHHWPDENAAWLEFTILDTKNGVREDLYSPTAEECEKLCEKYGVNYYAVVDQFANRRRDVHTVLLDVQRLPNHVRLNPESHWYLGPVVKPYATMKRHNRNTPKEYVRTDRPVKALQLQKFDDGTDNAEAIREMLGGGVITRKEHGMEEDTEYRKRRSLVVEFEDSENRIHASVYLGEWLVLEEDREPFTLHDEFFREEYVV